MFNGIIFNTGKIKSIKRSANNALICIETGLKFTTNDLGSSVSCNGVCLTVTNIYKDFISFYLSNETLKKTNFQFSKKGDLINLEKSLLYGTKISGHYVQGHTDTKGKVKKILILDKTWIVKFQINKIYSKFLIEKGSIAINGVSLTISKVNKNDFEINIIPHTLKLTNLIKLKANNYSNIEFDIFSKYSIKLKK